MSAEELAGALDDVRPTGSLDRTNTQWFRTAVFYEVLVRSFKDSNGDGIGDFKGLESKLDYLQWLGVDCLWLPPFYDSPLRDGGYDISDYRWIREELGTIEDFKTFLDAAHDRGLRVIIDFVMNHTSDSHPWFQASRSDPDGPFGNFYVWSDTDEKYSDARIIFLDTEKSNWKWDEQRGQYYWHRFFHHQPDLNFDEPRVIDEMFNAVRFWMDMGIDGFRLDAVPYLVEEDGTNCENLSGTHEILKDLRAMVDREYPGRILLCEANQWPEDVVEYFGAGDECQMAFHFPVMPRLFMALRQHSRMSISDILARTPQIPDGCQWGTFLRNHDELTLEMVTAQEREYLWDQYAPEDRMRCNLGIRRRLATLVGNDQDQIRLLHAMLLALPGSPVLYYGDEIGMGDDPWLPDRDGVRTPMQWDNSPSAGFSDAPPEKFHLPVIDQFGYRPARVNV
ncbi:MAG: maltose alpha-D-glucosyltransferase, partial [Cutibacterium sp.]|nr:maltose alpha-D-glucosyltransferase [Cutibacterium sp.]